MALQSFWVEKGVKENSAWYTSYPAGWFFCLPDLITFITTSSTNKEFSLSFCIFKNVGIWWLQRMPSFQGLKSWAVNLLRLMQKSRKIWLGFFEWLVWICLKNLLLMRKMWMHIYLSLPLSPSLCRTAFFSLFPWCIVSLFGVSNWFFYFRGLELCQSSRVCLKLFIDLSFLLPLLSLWVFSNCQIFCI